VHARTRSPIRESAHHVLRWSPTPSAVPRKQSETGSLCWVDWFLVQLVAQVRLKFQSCLFVELLNVVIFEKRRTFRQNIEGGDRLTEEVCHPA
jgi:hypothetical protein